MTFVVIRGLNALKGHSENIILLLFLYKQKRRGFWVFAKRIPKETAF